MVKKYISLSEEETKAIAKELATELKPGDIVLFFADLGAGKSVFSKGIATALGVDESIVRSPTFTLMNIYSGGKYEIYHFDLYRISDVEELDYLGYEDFFYSNGISLVEWAEKLDDYAPANAIKVFITIGEDNKREIRIER